MPANHTSQLITVDDVERHLCDHHLPRNACPGAPRPRRSGLPTASTRPLSEAELDAVVALLARGVARQSHPKRAAKRVIDALAARAGLDAVVHDPASGDDALRDARLHVQAAGRLLGLHWASNPPNRR